MGREQILEQEFERQICESLGSEGGWLYTAGQSPAEAAQESSRLFDAELALIPSDVLWWLKSEYPDEYDKAIDSDLDETARGMAERRLLQHVVHELSKMPTIETGTERVRGGLLGVLREGFNYAQVGRTTAKFGPMMIFPPANKRLTEIAEASSRVRLRVLRQVCFDTKTNESIDVVLFVNGIPVITMELKTDNTQSCTAAEVQYRNDRKPSKSRILLQPGRCLVHFAVSNTRMSMTTALNGKNTVFLPFNQGDSGHSGNPLSSTGSDTDYLWRDVLSRDSFMRLLRNFAVWQKDRKNSHSGRLIFPRFHQRRAVERVIADVEKHGVGGKYLIWHSAGSGKTKTIAWLAHQMIRHMDAEGNSTFDSVIVITDRNVLDENIRGDMKAIQSSGGLVVTVGERRTSAKSKELREALLEGNHIITCTLQTFPEVVRLIEKEERLGDRSWAIIADEAHSSQSGSAAAQMRGLLAEMDLDKDESELSAEDLLLLKDSAIANSKNLTFVAFTATPKAKTLALFGTQVEDHYEAFDTYTMAQAIEEGFILDVLRNYSTYKMWLQVKNQIEENDSLDVNSDLAVQRILRFVRLNKIVVAQKVQIVVEHFRRNVMSKLDGQAKAMVVANSRKEAVRWALEIKKYLDENGYTDMDSLVAFSDTVTLDGNEYTESGMNGRANTATAFKEEDLNKVLIVARKFQTGFDEPRLLAMYVDKKLKGVETVQTLSRLNRIYPGKQDPMIVDFVNNPNDIQEDFKLYYEDASITSDINANALYTIGERLDSAGYYTPDKIVEVGEAYINDADGEHLQHLITPIRHHWNIDMKKAVLNHDKELKDAALAFRSDLIKYHNAWQFLSQIVDYQDLKLHYRAILANLLFRNLHVNDFDIPEDDSYMQGVELNGIKSKNLLDSEDFGLTKGGGEIELPKFDGKPGTRAVPQQSKFSKVIEVVNELFEVHGLDVSKNSIEGVFKPVIDDLVADPKIKQIASCSTAQQLSQSAQFKDAVEIGLFKFREESQEILSALEDSELLARVIVELAPVIKSVCEE